MRMRRQGLRAAVAMGLVLGAVGCGQRSTQAEGSSTGDTGTQPSNAADGGGEAKGGGKAVFAVMEHDFGEVEQGVSLSHVFKLRNEGTEALHIGKVRGS